MKKKNSIKRAQSQAGLSFAERKNFRPMAKILTLLALLMTAVTGAVAQEQSETIDTKAIIVEGTHFTISNNDDGADEWGMHATKGITVTPKNGETITKVVISCTDDYEYVNDDNTSVSSGTKEITNDGETITVTGVNASTFTFTCSTSNPQFGQFVVYYTEPAGPEVTWNAATKTGTFAMPGYDVELEVAYFNITVPTANTTDGDIHAGTATPLINAASTTEVGATIKYLVTATSERPTSTEGFSADVPTAEAITAPGTYYVWYYLDFATGDDSDISAQAIEVTVADYLNYTVIMANGTEDAGNWTITPPDATDPEKGVKPGTEIKATYSGTKRVKSVKAVKKPGPAATVTTAPTATTGDIVAGSETALVSGGTAEGGTMMYKVTTANTQPTSTEGFSADVPTAEGLTAGTYYVWYYVKADASHTDSEIAGPVSVTVAVVSLIVNPVVGQIIGSDGKNYDANATLPDGVTAVAMIAYLGNGSDCTNGLAIQLNSSPVTKPWSDAKTYASGLTAVPGGTWRLPSKADWQNMFLGCAKSGDDTNASDNMLSPIQGFKEKITAAGVTWPSVYYWSSSTASASGAWNVQVYLAGNYADARFLDGSTGSTYYVLGCLAF